MNTAKPFEKPQQGKITSQASSNIALIKYWGKYPTQIPANPSISYTLTHSYTQTEIEFEQRGYFGLEFEFEGKPNAKFADKIEKYLLSIQTYLPFISGMYFKIQSKNTFPHSSGIASSASSYAALALGLVEIEKQINHGFVVDYKKASFLARLGSGSACRSIYNELVVWGKTKEIEGSSDEYAIPYPEEIPTAFLEMNDAIALIHTGEKSVSSTLGHSLMNNHPFAQSRFEQANANFKKLKEAMARNDLMAFGEVVENEALSLHAMMMTSNPSFVLMLGNTVEAIHQIRNFRKSTGLPLFFTLDAGANVHILFPKSNSEKQFTFIKKNIQPLCVGGKIVWDCVKMNQVQL